MASVEGCGRTTMEKTQKKLAPTRGNLSPASEWIKSTHNKERKEFFDSSSEMLSWISSCLPLCPLLAPLTHEWITAIMYRKLLRGEIKWMADYNCFSPQKLRCNGRKKNRRKCELSFYIHSERNERKRSQSLKRRAYLNDVISTVRITQWPGQETWYMNEPPLFYSLITFSWKYFPPSHCDFDCVNLS